MGKELESGVLVYRKASQDFDCSLDNSHNKMPTNIKNFIHENSGMYMKALTLGLAAALAFSAAWANASVIDLTIEGESNYGPVPVNLWSESRFEGGDKVNATTILRDETVTFADQRWITHWADTSYDRQGGYREQLVGTYYTNYANGNHDYVYFKATAAAGFDTHLAVPNTVTASSFVSVVCTTPVAPCFPNLTLSPAAATIAIADSHDPADLTGTSSVHTSFDADGSYTVSYTGVEKLIPTGATLDMGVLISLTAELQATLYDQPVLFGLVLTGPLYDIGLHHFSESTYLGFEIQAIPEPATWAMLLAGVGIVGIVRRRKTVA
jgi:hypothetical protein